jgi:hypothetical protein
VSVRINVQGGTGAGRRPPLRDRPAAWSCGCTLVDRVKANGEPVLRSKQQPGYLVRCPVCGQPRP